MPASTTRALIPYMLDTDPLADVALHIKNLAQALDRLQPAGGNGSVTIATANGSQSVNITFPTPFASAPRVQATLTVNNPLGRSVSVSAVSATGCTIVVASATAATLTFVWTAHPTPNL